MSTARLWSIVPGVGTAQRTSALQSTETSCKVHDNDTKKKKKPVYYDEYNEDDDTADAGIASSRWCSRCSGTQAHTGECMATSISGSEEAYKIQVLYGNFLYVRIEELKQSSTFTREILEGIVNNGLQKANVLESKLLKTLPSDENHIPHPRIRIAVLNEHGKLVAECGHADAWNAAASIARAKAYTAFAFSSDRNAMSSRRMGAYIRANDGTFSRLDEILPIVSAAGGVPIYSQPKAGSYETARLIGAIGVAGDTEDIDEHVAIAAAARFFAPQILTDGDNFTQFKPLALATAIAASRR